MHHTGFDHASHRFGTMHHTGVTPCITQICGLQETHMGQGQLLGFVTSYDIYYESAL